MAPMDFGLNGAPRSLTMARLAPVARLGPHLRLRQLLNSLSNLSSSAVGPQPALRRAANGPERQRPDDRLERGLGYRDPDHRSAAAVGLDDAGGERRSGGGTVLACVPLGDSARQ
jgi:hypothetical protein